MDVFQNPNSGWVPTTPIGIEMDTYINAFMAKWQAGNATDLQQGLQDAQDQTNNALAQAQI